MRTRNRIAPPPSLNRPIRGGAFGVLALVATAMACDGTPRGRDLPLPAGRKVSEISVRLDVPSSGSPSVSVLAFRAEVLGFQSDDVLGVVDPLVASAPDAHCELRDVADTARRLRGHGGNINLEDVGNIAVEVGGHPALLRPTPRVYPDDASIVAGVIAEAGPTDLANFPTAMAIGSLGPEGLLSRIPLTVPDAPRVLGGDGAPVGAVARFDANGDLSLQVTGPGQPFVELRPFGATLAIACPVGSSGRVTIPADMIERLGHLSRKVPVAVDAVSRESHLVRVGGQPTRLSLEIRASTVLELRQ